MSDSAVSVTTACAARVHEVLARESAADASAGLRVEVVSGGCSGYQYRLALDRARDGDLVIEDGGIRVIVEAEHLSLVRGASIDFRTDGGDAGFRIDNPNVVYGCGCGNSFLLRDDAGAAA